MLLGYSHDGREWVLMAGRALGSLGYVGLRPFDHPMHHIFTNILLPRHDISATGEKNAIIVGECQDEQLIITSVFADAI